ncbi:hypothetical protein L7F22_034896 [Adiantum nelumboides]|nr:hypothetical protein [Adiantum nelumboides]
MGDPFLDYLNEVMMEEQGEQDLLAFMQDDVKASYNAIMSSLYDIVSEYPPLNSTSSERISDSDVIDENASGSQSHSWYESSHEDLHADINELCSILPSESQILDTSNNSLPACGNFGVSLEQQKAGTSCAKQRSSQAHNGSFTAAHDSESVAVRAISDLSFNVQDQEQTSSSGLLPLSADSTVQPSSTDISLEEFKDRAGYADLYVGKPIRLDTSKTTTKLNGEKKKSSRAARKGGRSVNAGAAVEGSVDLRELLLSCAQAVAIRDVKKASYILQELYQVHGASAKGNSLQRTAHYFGDALIARMRGMGLYQYEILCKDILSVGSLLKGLRIWYGLTPYFKTRHYFANQHILKAAEGASRLHILDYGFGYGLQWPCLINALADREGVPPLLVITGIDSFKPSGTFKPHATSLEWLKENGRRLAAYANTYNVPFQFHAIVSDEWEDIDPASLHLQESEVLVVNCMIRLRHHADESVDSNLTFSPRQKLLMSMRSLSPNLLLTAEINAAGNLPFFVSRFREVLFFYSNLMDMLDTVCHDDLDRFITTSFARQILNIVACEGAERVERPETYKQWDARIKRAGFELLPVPSLLLSTLRSYVKQHYHKDFIVHGDGDGWLLLDWKGRTMLNMAGWKPCQPSS